MRPMSTPISAYTKPATASRFLRSLLDVDNGRRSHHSVLGVSLRVDTRFPVAGLPNSRADSAVALGRV